MIMNTSGYLICKFEKKLMKSLLHILFLAALVCQISSCSKKNCGKPDIVILLHGFNSIDDSVMILRYYQRGSNFTVLYQSMNFYYPDTSEIGVNDTTDAMLTFPVIGKSYKITGISSGHDKMSGHRCTSGFTYYVNDTFHSVPAYPDSRNPNSIDVYR
jgi:hypothetical protein